MTTTSDVIVVGGGVNGASIAYHLARRGVSVTLVEKDNIAAGPTGRSCGIIRQHYSHPITARMALAALRFFENFEELVGGGCDFRQTGYIFAAGPDTIDTLKANVALQQSLGINTSVISVEELRDLEPGVATDGIVGAAYEPDSGYADPYSTSVAFANRAEELGAEVLVGTEIRSVIVEGGKARGVVTDDGRLEAASVVLATGPWSGRLSKLFGVELPITVCRVQVCLFERPPSLQHDKVFVDSPLGVYTRPEGEDLMLVGSVATDEAKAGVEHPDHFQRVADFDTVSRYSEQLIQRFPDMDKGRFVNGYASLYDVTPDWRPILDELPGIDNLYCCAGSSGHGFKLAPIVGEMMADLITTGKSDDDDINFFAFDRFARDELVDGGYPHKILG
ncbi:MAG: FAD-binding oxidoreductase [Acidobacteria bacterium]|nr:FAD-binding oxidoreductase [Acidobacteriota bacterium]